MNGLPASLSLSQALPFLGGVSIGTAYAAIRNDTFPVPVLKVNNRIVVPTKPLISAVGLTVDEALEILNAPTAPEAA